MSPIASARLPVKSKAPTPPSVCHLINLAYAHRKTIKWDPAKLTFADPSCDAAWLTRNYRAPWKRMTANPVGLKNSFLARLRLRPKTQDFKTQDEELDLTTTSLAFQVI